MTDTPDKIAPAGAAAPVGINADMGHMEATFTELATALDVLPQLQWPLFLAKTALILADRIGDSEVVREAVATALKDLER